MCLISCGTDSHIATAYVVDTGGQIQETRQAHYKWKKGNVD